MKKIKCIVLAYWLFPLLVVAQEFPIHLTEEGYIIIQVTISDSLTGNFILDTGAGAHVFSAKKFKQIESQATKAGYFTGFRHDGDRLDGAMYQIPFLALGEIHQKNPIVGVYPPLDDFGIDGLLSLKFFEDKPFTIDFKNSKLKVLKSEDVTSLTEEENIILPISVYQHTNILLDIFIPIQLNEETQMLAEFDTGSGYGAFIINPNYIKDLKLDTTKATPQAYTTQVSREKRMDYIHHLPSISVGTDSSKLKKENVSVIFREGLIYNALIGSGLFKDGKITIDIPSRRFIVHSKY